MAESNGPEVRLPMENGATVWTVGFDGCAKVHPFSRKVLRQEVSGQAGDFRIRLHCRDCVFAAEDEGKTWWRTREAAEEHTRSRPDWYVRWKTRGPRHEEYGRFAAEKD